MKTIQVYDKPMCCSTGVCGSEVDPVLPRFAADLEWLKSQGHRVERFNLAQQPQAFLDHGEVHRLLVERGTECLPVVVVDGRIVAAGVYPTRDQLAQIAKETQAQETPQVLGEAKSCCGISGCC